MRAGAQLRHERGDMNPFDPIMLDTGWRLSGHANLVSIQNLRADAAQELRRTFDLQPIGEVCLRFLLHIESAPGGTAVSVNGYDAGVTIHGQPFVADVTDSLTL